MGTPTYENEGVVIYNGDCLKLLSSLESELFDLVVTSPPYNIGKEYETIMDPEHYKQWSKEWIEQVYKVTKDDGAFWLNLGYFSLPNKANAIPIAYYLWDIIPFYFIQEIVWNYGAGVACKNTFSPRNEKFLWYVKNFSDYKFNLDAIRDTNVKYPNQKKNGKLRCNPLGKNPTDVWQIPKVTSGTNRSSVERTPHPAQFPSALIDRIVQACSNQGDLILDPFMGSGSTAEAALKAGRQVVGFEIEPAYIKIIGDRLDRFFENKRTMETQPELLFYSVQF